MMVLIYKILKLSCETQFYTSYRIFKACQMFEIDFELFKGLLVIEYTLYTFGKNTITTEHSTLTCACHIQVEMFLSLLLC